MAWLLTGDSIAVGLSEVMHPARVLATVGQGTTHGAAVAESDGHRRLVVSLGVNDDPHQAQAFRREVHRVLTGRSCVVWLTIPSHPAFNRVLRTERDRHHRLRLVDARVPTRDHVHPTPAGYRQIARSVRRALRACPNPEA
jgi:hypothetical protein